MRCASWLIGLVLCGLMMTLAGCESKPSEPTPVGNPGTPTTTKIELSTTPKKPN
jgi:hypothetical protein